MSPASASPNPQHIGFDHRAVTIDGQRRLIFSGAFHYLRAEASEWRAIMRRSREAGINCIESIVFWNQHEPEPGRYDFTGRRDLRRFMDIAHEEGLHFILRIGPYICGEYNYGGFPFWLRDRPGMRMRTENKPFQEAMEKWVRFLGDYVRPYSAANGGPIILVQMENEYGNVGKSYGEAGQRYLNWAVNLGARINLGVPLILCDWERFEGHFDQPVIQAINHFWAHEVLPDHWKHFPEQPGIWTENWTAWYDTWGHDHHVRDWSQAAAAAARFFAAGGTGMNYYMWFGGTNFDREAMYLQTTSYDYEAPLDEHGLATTKARHLGRLHHLLQAHSALLLQDARPEPVALGEKQFLYTYRANGSRLDFLCNDDKENSAVLSHEGKTHTLPPRAVLIFSDGRLVFDTHRPDPSDGYERRRPPVANAWLSPWECYAEPVPAARPESLSRNLTVKKPVDQLTLTRDETDYCWYSTTLKVTGRAATRTLRVTHGGDFLRVFVDGKQAATSALPLQEARGKITGSGRGFAHEFQLDLSPGVHRLDLLACAIGLIKGDWSLGFMNMVEERKGIWGQVLLDGKPLPGPWTLAPGLIGETAPAWSPAGEWLPWKTAGSSPKPHRQPAWWRVRFRSPHDEQGISLDLTGLSKGLAWINGHCLGRYWLVPTLLNPEGNPTDTPGEVTQRYYKAPASWLNKPGEANTLVLFDEEGASPANIRVCRHLLKPAAIKLAAQRKPAKKRPAKGLTTTMTGLE
ncbi:MAG: beta-galactosidase [Terrimicrobiaceae bacterium]